jgi:hypothetical protein
MSVTSSRSSERYCSIYNNVLGYFFLLFLTYLLYIMVNSLVTIAYTLECCSYKTSAYVVELIIVISLFCYSDCLLSDKPKTVYLFLNILLCTAAYLGFNLERERG